MFRLRFALAVVLTVGLPFASAWAAKKSQNKYVGVMVSWDQVEKPNRLAGALRGAVLGAALTPPPPSEPSGAGDGISRTAQGVIATQQAEQRMRYPTRWFTIYSFHSGYYILDASMRSSKKPKVRTGDTVHFRIKKQTLLLTDDLGKTFKLKIVGMRRTSAPYIPAAGAGRVFSPGSP